MPRPGPRPYECVRRAWHSESHQPLRGSLTQEIFRIVTEFHSSETRNKKEWQEKLPIVVLRAEEILYSKARTEAEYTDLSTLKSRLEDAVNTMIRRTDDATSNSKEGPYMEPCVEAALALGCAPKANPRNQRSCAPSRASSLGCLKRLPSSNSMTSLSQCPTNQQQQQQQQPPSYLPSIIPRDNVGWLPTKVVLGTAATSVEPGRVHGLSPPSTNNIANNVFNNLRGLEVPRNDWPKSSSIYPPQQQQMIFTRGPPSFCQQALETTTAAAAFNLSLTQQQPSHREGVLVSLQEHGKVPRNSYAAPYDTATAPGVPYACTTGGVFSGHQSLLSSMFPAPAAQVAEAAVAAAGVSIVTCPKPVEDDLELCLAPPKGGSFEAANSVVWQPEAGGGCQKRKTWMQEDNNNVKTNNRSSDLTRRDFEANKRLREFSY